jgi:hypothetical protein
MIIRIFGILIGLFLLLGGALLIYLAFIGKGDLNTALVACGGLVLALAMLGYGFGGQKFLRRYFPKLAEKESSEDQSHNPFL